MVIHFRGAGYIVSSINKFVERKIVLELSIFTVSGATIPTTPNVDLVTGKRGRLFELSFQIMSTGGTGGACAIGLRPEDIAVDRTAGGDHPVAASVYEVEPLGAFTIVDLSVGDLVLRAQLTGQPHFELGEAGFLTFDQNKCHLFEDEGGTRLATGCTY